MAKKIFDLLADISQNKIAWKDQTPSDQKQFSSYMVNRFLSMDMNLIEIVNEVQVYSGQLGDEMTYNVYLDILPKKRFFAKYINVKQTPEREQLKSFLMGVWNLASVEVDDLIDHLTKDELVSEIKAHTGLTDKEIIKKYKL